MKKINFIKIVLDILMSIVFVLLFNKTVLSGMEFHQIAGLAIGVAFIIHIALNRKWVKQVTLKLFSSKINFKTKFGYILDVILLLCFAFIIISGILISKVEFPFKMLHISISYIALLLVGVHIGLHWSWVMNVFKNIFGIRSKNKILSIIAKLAVVLLFIFGSYNIYSVQYFSKVSSIVTSFSGNQPQMKGGEMKGTPPTGQTGEIPMKGGTQGGGETSAGGPTSSNIFGIIFSYASVISIFSIITFYLEKLLVKRRLVKKA